MSMAGIKAQIGRVKMSSVIRFINPSDLTSKLGGIGFTNNEFRKFSQLTEGIKKEVVSQTP